MISSDMTLPVPLKTAVLFLVFNRPESTAQVFDAIRKAKPPRLYVAADGPRDDCAGEPERVAKVREISTAVDWPCELKTLFRDKNLGCKHAVSGGISWFFEHEEQGIILEDDCLPHPDFFPFCETLLDRYANDDRVWVITGDNFQNGMQRGDASYYFSHYPHIWGWATWQRVWKNYDVNLTFWPKWKRSEDWRKIFSDRVERRYWEKVFDDMYEQKVDTWDYQVIASAWFNYGLTATPNVNLISNIGFGTNSTHTSAKDSPFSNMAVHSLGEILHPSEIRQNMDADRFDFDWQFGGRKMRFPYSLARAIKQFIKYLLSFVKVL